MYENGSSSNSSGPTVTRPFVVSCGPIQLALPPSDRVKRQEGGGPSGSLTSPSGGSTVQPDGSIDIVYAPVTEGGQTFAIDAVLSSEAANYTVRLPGLALHLRRTDISCIDSWSTVYGRQTIPTTSLAASQHRQTLAETSAWLSPNTRSTRMVQSLSKLPLQLSR